MTGRILINLDQLQDLVESYTAPEIAMHVVLCDLADDLNAQIPDYEIAILHLDTMDYLAFTKHSDPAELATKRFIEQARRQISQMSPALKPHRDREGDEYA